MADKKRALVTGLNGFTGQYVEAELNNAGYDVYGIDARVTAENSKCYEVDLGDAPKLKQIIADINPHVVVHLAAVAFVGHGDPNAFYQVNVLGTRNLLEALAQMHLPPECVLLASSANVYGNSVGGVLDEETSLNPANDYAVSKLSMEYMAGIWKDRLPIVISRPFNYTGVGQSENFLIPKIVDHFNRRAEVIELGNLDVWRDFSDVRAVAEAYRRLIEIRPAGQIVNVCSGLTHSLREVLSMAEEITGHRIEVQVNPAFVRKNEVRSLCGDPGRLRSLIGSWQTPPLEDTLRWMLR